MDVVEDQHGVGRVASEQIGQIEGAGTEDRLQRADQAPFEPLGVLVGRGERQPADLPVAELGPRAQRRSLAVARRSDDEDHAVCANRSLQQGEHVGTIDRVPRSRRPGEQMVGGRGLGRATNAGHGGQPTASPGT